MTSTDALLKAALQTYLVEARELLAEMEQALLNLEQADAPGEDINAIFRAAHTIKGSAGLFGLDDIVTFTHGVESLLDELREGRLGVTAELIAVLLPCCDHIAALLNNVEDETQTSSEQTARGDALTIRLHALMTGHLPVETALPPAKKLEADTPSTSSGNWHISVRFGPDCLRNGMDPLSFIRYLATLGTINHLTLVDDAMPAASDMDPETCYLGFEMDIDSDAGKAELEQAFDFVRDDCILHILPADGRVEDYIELIRALPEDDVRLGEILVASGVLTARELELGLRSQTGASPPPLGEILVEQPAVQRPIVDAALEKQKTVREAKNRESQTLRVDASRLDTLIDLVGELVIAGAGVNLRARKGGDTDLVRATHLLMRLVESVRDSALQLRMIPIGSTFSRFQRVVREVSAELGKDIALQISGGDTEVDKTLVEKIGDPLMHLVRNSMDHGIEPADVRRVAGKPAQGTVRLNAYHDGGSIVIEVADDGAGLRRDRIVAKAVERGIIASGDDLTDKEVFDLIFQPGFSTAAQVTNLSGRGVGMDVVKRNIADLRGSIEIDSVEGAGTCMRIQLPLTLAIIDGFLVETGTAAFVIPLERVIECLAIDLSQEYDREYMDLRGDVLPLISLRKAFGITEQPSGKRGSVVVVNYGNNKAGVIVDVLMGEFQTVIKPLGNMFEHLQGISGSTILGTGQVALILDIPALVERHIRAEKQHREQARLAAPP